MLYNATFTEDEVAAIQAAISFWTDINNNPHLTEEQYEAGQGALIALEGAL